jgi:hypothetical protein
VEVEGPIRAQIASAMIINPVCSNDVTLWVLALWRLADLFSIAHCSKIKSLGKQDY